jgi:hypothetical protein
MNISLVLLAFFYFFFQNDIVLNFRRKIIFSFFILLTLHLFYSIFFTVSLYQNSIKFFFVILFLIIAYEIKKLPVDFIKIFLFFLKTQAILIIITEIICLFVLDSLSIALFRDYIRVNEWGDIYSNGLFYHIQIKGNALLPFAYMITFLNKNERQYTTKIVLSLGLIFAGNFAFILSILIFHLIKYLISLKQRNNLHTKIVIGLLFIITTAYPIYNFTTYKINTKVDDSIFERVEQKNYLIEDLTKNPLVFLFGNGLGCTLDKQSSTRDYRDSTYFEMQPLYFLDQLGLILFVFFLFLNYYLSTLNYNDNLILLVYFSYLIYSFTNPYILDTNQFVVILILNTLQHTNQINLNNL